MGPVELTILKTILNILNMLPSGNERHSIYENFSHIWGSYMYRQARVSISCRVCGGIYVQ